MTANELSLLFPYLSSELIEQINTFSSFKSFEKGTEILREGQYVNVIPIVVKGLVKVMSRYEEKDLLLYYITPKESCVMSFTAGLNRETSKIYAITEEPSDILLIPSGKITEWIKSYPEFNTLFYRQFNQRYSDLLETITHVLFDNIDVRLYDYLVEKSKLTQKNPIKILHREIANDLGTAREVISRVMKKLEQLGKIKQHYNSIEILDR